MLGKELGDDLSKEEKEEEKREERTIKPGGGRKGGGGHELKAIGRKRGQDSGGGRGGWGGAGPTARTFTGWTRTSEQEDAGPRYPPHFLLQGQSGATGVQML